MMALSAKAVQGNTDGLVSVFTLCFTNPMGLEFAKLILRVKRAFGPYHDGMFNIEVAYSDSIYSRVGAFSHSEKILLYR